MLCTAVFAIVSFHAMTPHRHSCAETHESHLHGFAHCEQLGIFIPADTDQDTAPFTDGFTAVSFSSVPADCGIESETAFDLTDKFFRAENPSIGGIGLRAPPSILFL